MTVTAATVPFPFFLLPFALFPVDGAHYFYVVNKVHLILTSKSSEVFYAFVLFRARFLRKVKNNEYPREEKSGEEKVKGHLVFGSEMAFSRGVAGPFVYSLHIRWGLER